MNFFAKAAIRRSLLSLLFLLGVTPSLLSHSGFDVLRFMRRIPLDERGAGIIIRTHHSEDPALVEMLERAYDFLGHFGWTDYGCPYFYGLFLVLSAWLLWNRKDLDLSKIDYFIMAILFVPVAFLLAGLITIMLVVSILF